MNDLNISATNVIGHKEAPGQSTSCPGYSVSQLDNFRRELARAVKPAPVEKVEVDKKVPLKVSLDNLKFDANEWGTKIVEVEGRLKVLGTQIMTRFGSPNIKSDRGGWAQAGWRTEFDRLDIAGGFLWARYSYAERIKYIPIAEVVNGEIGPLWVEFE